MGAVYLLLQNNLIMVRVPLQLAGGGDVRRAVADRAYSHDHLSMQSHSQRLVDGSEARLLPHGVLVGGSGSTPPIVPVRAQALDL